MTRARRRFWLRVLKSLGVVLLTVAVAVPTHLAMDDPGARQLAMVAIGGVAGLALMTVWER